MSRLGLLQRWWRQEPFIFIVTTAALVYVAASWSPSAYGRVLKAFEVADHGLIFGWPQEIRSDEYAIWTPTIQAVVANDFGSINETSYYRESFRSLSSMPIRDWGLIFKPFYWPFFVLSPARAYSAYHAFHAWALLIGWTLLFRRLGVARAPAVWASLLIFGMSWVQFWWTSLAPVVAGAPWLGLIFLAAMPTWLRATAAAYFCASWLLDGLFYPPLILGTSVVVCLAILAFRPESIRVKAVVATATGVVAGCAIVVTYLWEPLRAIVSTVTHGQRNFSGGMVPWQDWLGTFLPSFPFRGFTQLFGSNSCESSSGGSILILLLLAFGSLRRGPWREDAELRRLVARSVWFFLLFIALSVWMTQPVPAIWGKALLWHLTPPTRLLLLPGLIVVLLVLLWLPRFEFKWTVLRALVASTAILTSWFFAEDVIARLEGSLTARDIHDNSDFLLLAVIWLLPVIARGVSQPASLERKRVLLPSSTILATAAAANFLLFSYFNPIQSSRVIFAHHDSTELRNLRRIQDEHPEKILVAGSLFHYFGSILNGLGFRSINHSLLNPQLDDFRRVFPELEEQRLNQLFNRYINVQLSAMSPPHWKRPLKAPMPFAAEVLLPVETFLPDLEIELAKDTLTALPAAPDASTRLATVQQRQVEIEVSGPIKGVSGSTKLTIHMDPAPHHILGSWRSQREFDLGKLEGDLYPVVFVRVRFKDIPDPSKIGWCVAIENSPNEIWQVGPDGDAGRSTCPTH